MIVDVASATFSPVVAGVGTHIGPVAQVGANPITLELPAAGASAVAAQTAPRDIACQRGADPTSYSGVQSLVGGGALLELASSRPAHCGQYADPVVTLTATAEPLPPVSYAGQYAEVMGVISLVYELPSATSFAGEQALVADPAPSCLSYSPSVTTSWIPAEALATTLYLCKITGTWPELTIPMLNFTATYNADLSVYLSVNIPDPATWGPLIASRPIDEVVIYKGYRRGPAVVLALPVVRGRIDSFRSDLGGRSGSGTLIARAAPVPESQRPVVSMTPLPVTGISYQSWQTSGKRLWRCQVNPDVLIGMRVQDHNGAEMTVGSLSYTVNPANAVMEITEA